MIKQDENGVFTFTPVQNARTPFGNPKRIIKQGDTVVRLDPWENRGEGLAMEAATIVQTQKSANGTTHTTKFRITDVHYAQETIKEDGEIRRWKKGGLDIRIGANSQNTKSMDLVSYPPTDPLRRPGVDWPMEKPGDLEEDG